MNGMTKHEEEDDDYQLYGNDKAMRAFVCLILIIFVVTILSVFIR